MESWAESIWHPPHSLWEDILTHVKMQSCNCNKCSENGEMLLSGVSRRGISPDQRGPPEAKPFKMISEGLIKTNQERERNHIRWSYTTKHMQRSLRREHGVQGPEQRPVMLGWLVKSFCGQLQRYCHSCRGLTSLWRNLSLLLRVKGKDLAGFYSDYLAEDCSGQQWVGWENKLECACRMHVEH